MAEFAFVGSGMTFAGSNYPYMRGALAPNGLEVSCDYECLVKNTKRFQDSEGKTRWIIEVDILSASQPTGICQVGQTYAISFVENKYDTPKLASFFCAFTGRSQADFILVPENDRINFVAWCFKETADKRTMGGFLQRQICVGIMPKAIREKDASGTYHEKIDPTTGRAVLGIPNYNFTPRGAALLIQPGGTPVVPQGTQAIAAPVAPPVQAPVQPPYTPPVMTAAPTPPMMTAPVPPALSVMTPPPPPVPTVQVVWDATGQFRNPVTNLLYFAGRGAAGGATHISINNATFVDYNPAIHTAPDGSGPRM